MAGRKTLKLRIDADKCMGHNRCKALAPDLIVLDRFGSAQPAGDGVVPPALDEKARLVKTNCPEFAVDITEE